MCISFNFHEVYLEKDVKYLTNIVLQVWNLRCLPCLGNVYLNYQLFNHALNFEQQNKTFSEFHSVFKPRFFKSARASLISCWSSLAASSHVLKV